MSRWIDPDHKAAPGSLAFARYHGLGLDPLAAGRAAGKLELELPNGQEISLDLGQLEKLRGPAQAKAMGLLKDIEHQLTMNPLLSYRPASCRVHPRSQECTAACVHAAFHTSIGHPLRAFFGGNRSGKTTTAIVDNIIQMTPPELLPPSLRQFKGWACPFYCRVMTPDMQRTMVPVIYSKLKDWLPKALLKRGRFEAAFDKTAFCLRLECGCRFDFLSYEMDLDKFGGSAMHRCHYDETPPASIRKECLVRLADYGGDELFSLTPLNGLDFTFKEVWKRREEPHVFACKISIHDNPTLDKAAVDYVAQVLSADEKEAASRLHGDFLHQSGLVYPGFTNAIVPPWSDEQIGRCENVIGIDPGIRFAGITFNAFDRFNACHTWKAVKLRNAVAEDYANEIKATLHDHGLKLEDCDIVADPNMMARGAATGENVMDELARYEIYAAKADNKVEVGVKGIRRRLRNDWLTIADPEQGAETQDLLDELEEYAMKIDADADDGEFKTVKVNDHCADAWRYAIQHRPWLPELAHGPRKREGQAWWETDDPRAHILRARGQGPVDSVMGPMA